MNRYVALSAFCLATVPSCLFASGAQQALSPVSVARAGVGYGVYADAGYACITNNDGVVVFDVHEPRHPVQVSVVRTGYTLDIVVRDGWGYIAGEQGLVVANLSNPADPRLAGECAGVGVARRVRVDGNYAYVAGAAGLLIADISDPGEPVEVALLAGEDAWGVDVDQGTVYLAVPGRGLEVIDARNPTSPQVVGTVPGTQGAWDVHIHGVTAYVACRDAGVMILALAPPALPRVISRHNDNDGGEALGVWGDGEYLFVADNNGVEVLDVRDPGAPWEIGSYDRVNGAHDLHVHGATVYVAEGRKGLIVLEFSGGPSVM